MVRLATVAVLALVASGCTRATTWQKPGATPQDYETDAFNCAKQMHEHGVSEFSYMSGAGGFAGRSSITPVPSGPTPQHYVDNCLVTHGWTREPADK
jgi:hypothetical protein